MVGAAPDPDQLLDELLQVVVLLGDDMNQQLAERGLSRPRAELLWVLGRQGPSTQASLASHLRVSSRNITGLVDGLAETGFVIRAPHPSDRRAILVTLTEQGQSSYDRLLSEKYELAADLFGKFPDAQRRQLSAHLTSIIETLMRLVAEAQEATTAAYAGAAANVLPVREATNTAGHPQ
jgi:DNA-binding MarR family transcriptional regulator